MGGSTEAITAAMRESYAAGQDLRSALGIAVMALRRSGGRDGELRDLEPLEVAVLELTRPRRAFRRITGDALAELLPDDAKPSANPPEDDRPAG
jgi:proteasome alpha subunit